MGTALRSHRWSRSRGTLSPPHKLTRISRSDQETVTGLPQRALLPVTFCDSLGPGQAPWAWFRLLTAARDSGCLHSLGIDRGSVCRLHTLTADEAWGWLRAICNGRPAFQLCLLMSHTRLEVARAGRHVCRARPPQGDGGRPHLHAGPACARVPQGVPSLLLGRAEPTAPPVLPLRLRAHFGDLQSPPGAVEELGVQSRGSI